MTIIVHAPPPLDSGDRLSRAEFHRRYCARPDIKKAELVDGVVYVASPVRFEGHGEEHAAILNWLSTYRIGRPGVRVADNSTVFLSEESEVQPDALMFRDAPGGSLQVTDDKYLAGAPELVVEVAASSASYDLHDKLHAYERAGVLEYIVWEVLEARLSWFELRDGVYQRRVPDTQGIVESRVFAGLRLDIAKLLANDPAGVLAALRSPAESSAAVPNLPANSC